MPVTSLTASLPHRPAMDCGSLWIAVFQAVTRGDVSHIFPLYLFICNAWVCYLFHEWKHGDSFLALSGGTRLDVGSWRNCARARVCVNISAVLRIVTRPPPLSSAKEETQTTPTGRGWERGGGTYGGGGKLCIIHLYALYV
ncbi:hypothetical protein FKM82_011723 [Ascaphus truei]